MRKTKLTPGIREAVLDAIRAGNTNKTSAALAGISEATLYNWLAKGRDEEPPEGLDQLSGKELKTRAKHMRIKGASRLKREDLITAIEKASCVYADFLEAYELATAEAHAYHVDNIRRAALEDWRASMTYLERRDPENWAKHDRVQADINHSGGIKTEHEENYSIEVEHRLAQDPELQKLYMAIWERQQLANSD